MIPIILSFALGIVLTLGGLMAVLLWRRQTALRQRQDALGQACRTLAEAISALPNAEPVTIDPDVPQPPTGPWVGPDAPYTRTPTTVEPWVIGEREEGTLR